VAREAYSEERSSLWSQDTGDDDGPTSGRDIINECDYDYYYSD